MTERELLQELNRSELIQMARTAGLGNTGRDCPEVELIDAILRGNSPKDAPSCPLEGKRKKIERHIEKNKRRILSQLPGCNGCCTTYGCPDLVVVRCWEGFRRDIF